MSLEAAMQTMPVAALHRPSGCPNGPHSGIGRHPENGDVIAGLTWETVAQLQTWLWIERVMSASNPIDQVGRKNFEGWDEFETARLPRVLLRRLRQEVMREKIM